MRAYLFHFDLKVVHRRRLDFGVTVWILKDTLDKNNRLPCDPLDPPDHVLRNEALLLCHDSLGGGHLMPEDEEDDLGAWEARQWVQWR